MMQILTEAEAIRCGRIMREFHELLGGLMSIEKARGRMAELSEEAEKTASPDFRDRWNISGTEAQSYHNAVKHLINLYTLCISALHNLQVPHVIAISGEERLSDALPITHYDELSEEHARLRESLESCGFALNAHAGNVQSLAAEYRKLKALAVSEPENMNGPDAQVFLSMRKHLEIETALVALSIGYARMEVELSYSRAIVNVYEKMVERLRRASENIRFTKEDLGLILSGIQETIAAREAELPRAIDELASISEGISGILSQMELHSPLKQDFLQHYAALYKSASDSPAQAEAALLVARYVIERFRMYSLMIEIRILLNMTELWRTRHGIFTGEITGEMFWNTRSDAESVLDQNDKDEDFIRQNIDNIQLHYLIIEALTDKAEPEVDLVLRKILDIFKDIQIHTHSKIETSIRAQRLLAMNIVSESTEKIDSLRFTQRLARMRHDFTHAYMGRVLWHGSGYEVTTYDLTLAILILLIGALAGSIFSRLIVRMIAYRRKIDNTFLAAVQRIFFYLFIFFCSMLALDAINVPLTAFAFAGGAMTIAVGFGSRVIFSNQISGMVIFFSRSFGHGDIIEVDGAVITVQEIGMRATRGITFDGVEIMVPNSYFMENKIINYTRKSGQMKRNSLRVRVAGDCDPKEVEAILSEEIKNYRYPLRKKDPFVALADFSLRSIDFDVYYWYDYKNESPSVIAGNIRMGILQKLREHGVKLYDPHERVLNNAQ